MREQRTTTVSDMFSMRWSALFVLLIALGALAGWEILWRMHHFPVSAPVFGGHHIAQVRSLPDSSELPYGHGIFVRHRRLPLWTTSRLVFAAYCKPGASAQWLAGSQLTVHCTVAQGQPLRFPPPEGITLVNR